MRRLVPVGPDTLRSIKRGGFGSLTVSYAPSGRGVAVTIGYIYNGSSLRWDGYVIRQGIHATVMKGAPAGKRK